MTFRNKMDIVVTNTNLKATESPRKSSKQTMTHITGHLIEFSLHKQVMTCNSS